MIWSWGKKKENDAPRGAATWPRVQELRGGELEPRQAVPKSKHCFLRIAVLYVRSIIKRGSIKYYWKTKLNWRGKVPTLERNILGAPPQNKSRGKEARRGQRTDSSTQFPTASLLWEERHPPKGQMSAGPWHCPRLPRSAFSDFTDTSFPNG